MSTTTSDTHPHSLHDALPISAVLELPDPAQRIAERRHLAGHHRRGAQHRADLADPSSDHPRGDHDRAGDLRPHGRDRKSTRLNSSHLVSSYAVLSLIQKTKRN